MKIPYSQLIEAVKENMYGLGNIGFCLSCGEEQDGCEPDAEEYECSNCGLNKVYGAEQVLLMGEYKKD